MGGLRLQLPPKWAQHAAETPAGADGTIFTAELPKQAWLRIRVLPGSGGTPKSRKSTQDIMHDPAWADIIESIKAQGYDFEDAGNGRSRSVGGIVEESMVIATIDHGEKKGYRIAQWITAEKVIRAEITYTRKMRRQDWDEMSEAWGSVKYDRPGGGDTAPAVATVPVSAPGTPVAAVTPAALTAPIPSARTKPRTPAEIVQDFRDSLVFIEGPHSSGSGFIYKTAEGVFLMTNQHVMAGMNTVKCTRLDGTAVKLGAGGAAVGHDEVRFATDAPTLPFELGEHVENFAKIGDEIVVLGNAEGARVIAPLRGKLLGLGPDRIEVDAAFVPGNSGSPIIHVPTGRVIGIATYLERRRYTELADKNEPKIRRFGYRLDSVKQWQPMNWAAFQAENTELGKIQNLTRDFGRMLDGLSQGHPIDPSEYSGSALGGILGDLAKARSRQAMSAPDRQRALENFLRTLRSTTQADLTAAKTRLRYDFFLRQLADESAIRGEFFQIFDRLTKNLTR